MEQPLNWGVISTARIGTEKVIPALQKSAKINVLALASRSLEKSEQAAQELGIARAYGSYEELFSDPDIDIVYNPLPNHLHVPMTLQALDAGKHVLCEKPIALTATESELLLDATRRTGKIVQEAFMVRQNPQWLRALDLVSSGAIGDLRAIQGVFSYFNDDQDNIRNKREIGGGGIYDIGCYLINTARMITGREPTRVSAVIDRDPLMKIDRTTSALMLFPGGVQASWLCSTQMVPHQRVCILGTKARLEVEVPFNAPNDRPCRLFFDDGRDPFGGGVKIEEFPVVDQYTLQGELFSHAVQQGSTPPLSLQDSVANMKVIDAIFKAGELQQWIDL